MKDPFAIVRVKTLIAGLANTTLGVVFAAGTLPSWQYVFSALVLGSLSYGVSVVLDAFALRLIGAAREAAYFATAPFVGALASMILLGDPNRTAIPIVICRLCTITRTCRMLITGISIDRCAPWRAPRHCVHSRSTR